MKKYKVIWRRDPASLFEKIVVASNCFAAKQIAIKKLGINDNHIFRIVQQN